MLDAEQRIADWRAHANRVGALTQDEVDELENHLREALEAQVAGGVPPQVAMTRAIQGLGPLQDLESEFSKLRIHRRARGRLVWMLLGFVALEAVQLLSRLLTTLAAGPGSPIWPERWSTPEGLLLLYWSLVLGLGVWVVRKAIGWPHAPSSDQTSFRRPARWPAPVLIVSVLLAFTASTLVIDHLYWWTSQAGGSTTRSVRVATYWLNVFELALAPTIAFAGLIYLRRPGGRSRRGAAPLDRQGLATLT